MIEKYRTKIRIPLKQYKVLKELADLSGLPVSTLLSLLISDFMDCPTEHEITVNSTNRSWKEKDSTVKSYTEINIVIAYKYRNKVAEIIEQAKEGHYSFNEFIIECIEHKINEDFINIINNKGRIYSEAQRIHNSTNVTYTNKDGINSKIKQQMYSDEAKEQYPLAAIQEYIRFKARQYNTTPKRLTNYYAMKEINHILAENEYERDIFMNPKDYEEDY